MTIGVVHPYPVHRTAVGGTTRVYELVKFLAPRHDVSVFTHTDGPAKAGDDDELRQWGVRQISIPRPKAPVTRRLRWLGGLAPYAVRYNENPALSSALAAADRRRPFDVLHVELGHMTPYFDAVGPHALRVLAEQECAALATARLRQLPWRERSWYDRMELWRLGRTQSFDRQALPRVDLIYGITPAEAAYLTEVAGRPVGVLPHIVPCDRFQPAQTAQTELVGRRVLFVGNFAHRPNVDALHWFASAVWPLVRMRVPEADGHVVGYGLNGALEQVAETAGLRAMGYVPELAAAYRHAAVVVNPVRLGGGMRGKVLEAMASGAAVVSTSTGLEGIDANPGSDCTVADTATAFADGVVSYLQDAERRRCHGARARDTVLAKYDPGVVFSRLEADYTARRADAAARWNARRP